MKYKEKSFNKRLGSCLKKLREQKQISLNLFAYENDLTTATVSRVENGITDAKISTLMKYANALEMPISDVFAQFEVFYDDNDF